MRGIERQSDYYGSGRTVEAGNSRKEKCDACGDWARVHRHAMFNQDWCANCTEAADGLSAQHVARHSGPTITAGMLRPLEW